METNNLQHKRIVISRIDSIGDVLLTLPICNWIKANIPNAYILFLGKSYTLPILNAYEFVDEVCNWSEMEDFTLQQKIERFESLKADTIIHVFPNKEIAQIAKKAKITNRIGTSHRAFHFLTCNHLVNFTRKRSEKHEAQLNFELLKPLGWKETPTMEELNAATTALQPKEVDLPSSIAQFISEYPKYVILHPKSQGSAMEWPTENYGKLASLLSKEGYAVAFTGTDKEGAQFRGYIPTGKGIVDTSGLMSLEQLLYFIQKSQGIIACSTGPLHIGGFLGVRALGIFSSRKPIHPGRWHAIGQNTSYIVHDENCEPCAKGETCKCIEKIKPEEVLTAFLG